MQWQEFRTSVRHLHAKDVLRIEQAFALGKKMHGDQKRKSGETYFSHPIAVATMLASMGADADTLIAALLHDTIEDTPLTLEEISTMFGGSVRTLIDGVTKLKEEDVAHSPKLNEQMESLRKMFTLMNEDIRIMVMKLVDRLHNMQTIEFLSPERQQTMAQETMDVYAKIADRLCMQDVRDELDALCLEILEPATYESVYALREKNERKGMLTIEDIRSQLRSLDPVLSSRIQLSYEFKTWTQLRSQVEMGDALAQGTTTLTVAFVCEDADTCYRVLGALHRLWKREVLSFQDFINAPQLNGYQGVHTTLLFPDGSRIRCKIRTRDMHEYARKGIATRCFDSKAEGIDTYLPWTKRISDLASYTEGSSDDFWQSLQSDILGESIVIHGPDDQTAQVPKDATALDGAFYLLQENALKTSKILVNGIEATYDEPLKNASSVEVILSNQMTYNHDWLRYVHTAHAHGKIRKAFTLQPVSKKRAIGRTMLQEVFTQKKRGILEEFDEERLLQKLKSAGYSSLEKVYESISDGRVEAAEIYNNIFGMKTVKPTEKKEYILTFDSSAGERISLNNLLATWNASRIEIRESNDNQTLMFRVMLRLHKEDVIKVKDSIAGKNTSHLKLVSRFTLFLSRIAVPVLSLLWALDCLLGKLLIDGGVSPYDLTTLRFGTLCVISIAYFSTRTLLRKSTTVPLKSLSLHNRYLLICGTAMFITALSSYIALQTISTLTYGLSMNIGIATVLLMVQYRSRHPSRPLMLTCLAMIICTLWFLFHDTQSFFSSGFIGGLGCGAGFALYSYASRRYQQQESIHSRYPQFIFFYSSIALLLCVPLLYLHGFTLFQSSLFFPSLLFVIFLTALPYIVYFELLKYEEVKVTWSYIPLFLIIMTIGQYVLYGDITWHLVVPVLLAIAWQRYYEPMEEEQSVTRT